MAVEEEGFRANGRIQINANSITDYKLDKFKQRCLQFHLTK